MQNVGVLAAVITDAAGIRESLIADNYIFVNQDWLGGDLT